MASDKVTSALAQFAWEKRQLIIFSPNQNHQRYKQVESKLKSDFNERKLHTWYIVANDLVKLDSTSKSEINSQNFREYFDVKKNEFRLILIGYDQAEKLRQVSINIETLFSKIDQMPMRIQEMQLN